MRKRRRKNRRRPSLLAAWKRPVTFGGVSARIVMTVLAGLQVLSFLSMVVNPAKAWIFNVFGLMFLPLFTVNLLLFLWALKRRSRSCLIPLVALFPSVFFIGGYFQIPSGNRPAVPDPDDSTVKVVSYNVGRFLQASPKKVTGGRRACTDSVRNFLAVQDADIICLQEFYTTDVGRVKSFLSRWLPGYKAEYYFYRSRYGYYGNVTLSRMKAKDKGVIKFDNSANLALYTDYSAGGESFRVYNCHFESYNISFPGIVKGLFERRDGILRETERKMRHSLSLRPEQVDKVIEHISDCPTETILCGDFNDSPMSYTYQRLIRGHRDTFCEAGKGFGATYSILGLRIDYIFIPEIFETLSHISPKTGFSDHYPVISVLGACK